MTSRLLTTLSIWKLIYIDYGSVYVEPLINDLLRLLSDYTLENEIQRVYTVSKNYRTYVILWNYKSFFLIKCPKVENEECGWMRTQIY